MSNYSAEYYEVLVLGEDEIRVRRLLTGEESCIPHRKLPLDSISKLEVGQLFSGFFNGSEPPSYLRFAKESPRQAEAERLAKLPPEVRVAIQISDRLAKATSAFVAALDARNTLMNEQFVLARKLEENNEAIRRAEVELRSAHIDHENTARKSA